MNKTDESRRNANPLSQQGTRRISSAARTLVKLGTPVDIPDTSDGSGDKKPVPLHDQVAVDERVRCQYNKDSFKVEIEGK